MSVQISRKEFEKTKSKLYSDLVKALEIQALECAIPDVGSNPATDVFETPTVDSKTVIKLAPIVEAATGHKLKPDWIQKGGYNSIEEAAAHIVAQIASNCFETAQVVAVKAQLKRAA